ncbi:hypothetical protein C8Q77DRAFT_97346 [Trametes polyzona]|nr:hypothetical protein C8Q77DRAFT_97346 [Trametes polyzona]
MSKTRLGRPSDRSACQISFEGGACPCAAGQHHWSWLYDLGDSDAFACPGRASLHGGRARTMISVVGALCQRRLHKPRCFRIYEKPDTSTRSTCLHLSGCARHAGCSSLSGSQALDEVLSRVHLGAMRIVGRCGLAPGFRMHSGAADECSRPLAGDCKLQAVPRAPLRRWHALLLNLRWILDPAAARSGSSSIIPPRGPAPVRVRNSFERLPHRPRPDMLLTISARLL